jgi:hypothetical protein
MLGMMAWRRSGCCDWNCIAYPRLALHGAPVSAPASGAPPSLATDPELLPVPLLEPELVPLELPELLVLEPELLLPLVLPLLLPLPVLLPPLVEPLAPESVPVNVPVSSVEHAKATASGNPRASEAHRYTCIELTPELKKPTTLWRPVTRAITSAPPSR